MAKIAEDFSLHRGFPIRALGAERWRLHWQTGFSEFGNDLPKWGTSHKNLKLEMLLEIWKIWQHWTKIPSYTQWVWPFRLKVLPGQHSLTDDPCILPFQCLSLGNICLGPPPNPTSLCDRWRKQGPENFKWLTSGHWDKSRAGPRIRVPFPRHPPSLELQFWKKLGHIWSSISNAISSEVILIINH